MKMIYKLVSVLLLVALLAACAPPEPEKIIETVTVVETVVVQGETVVEEKIITATPAPPMDKVTLRVNCV